MENTARTERIDAYASADRRLREALQRYPREMWTYKPGPERWSIHEILLHLADSEANGYVRCRRCVAEPGSPVMAYDEERWARGLDYHGQDADTAVELFIILRRMSTALLRALPPEAWTRTIEHPERGTMTLGDWLEVYTDHVPAHLDQMEATFRAWEQAQQGASPDPGQSLFLFLK